MNITIDEATHTYTVDGRRLPGITNRLKANGMIDDEFFTEESRQRGAAVHLATQYADEPGGLDMSSVDPRLHGYLLAWTTFMEDFKIRRFNRVPETPVASLALGYATKIDRILECPNIPTYNGTGPCGVHHALVINIKTGVPYAWHAIQLAGEAIAYAETFSVPVTRITRAGVYLKDDGSYRFHRYENRRDLDVFRAAALLAAWKEQHA